MNMKVGKGCFRRGALLGVVFLCGCATEGDSTAAAGRAEALLTRSLSELEQGRAIVKDMRTEVEAGGVTLPGIVTGVPEAWGRDPRHAAPVLLMMSKTVISSGRESANPALENVQFVIPAAEWTPIIKEAWQEQLVRLEAEGAEALRQLDSVASDRELLVRELDSSLQQARLRLIALISSLEAEGTVTVRSKLSGSKPEKLVIENRMKYQTDNGQKEELIRTIYQFR